MVRAGFPGNRASAVAKAIDPTTTTNCTAGGRRDLVALADIE